VDTASEELGPHHTRSVALDGIERSVLEHEDAAHGSDGSDSGCLEADLGVFAGVHPSW